MNRVRWALFVSGMGLLASAGCWSSDVGINKRGWWQDWKDTAKAMSGTGDYLGWSPESREVERSMGAHRTKPIVSSSDSP